MTTDYDILICGCGPAGVTLANLLARSGHKIAVFERDEEVVPFPRAMVLDDESLRIFDDLGILGMMGSEDTGPFLHHAFVDEQRRPLMELDFSIALRVEGHPAAGNMFHQPTLERLLREQLASNDNVDLHYGSEVIEVDGSGDKARLISRNPNDGTQTEYTGKYLVGADGARSLCRRAIGGDRTDLNYSREWVVIDAIVHDQEVFDSLENRSEFMCRPNGAVVFVKGFHNFVRFDFEMDENEGRGTSEDEARALIADYFDPRSCEFVRIAPYQFHAGMPNRWRDGRLTIIGDAAHLTSPFAGQGLNMGIRDASNLAFKLDLVVNGQAGDGLLDTYQEERWENCAHLIRGASKRGQMISATSRRARFARAASFFIGRQSPQLANKLTQRMSGKVGYLAGLIGTNSELAGTKMPQPTVALPDKSASRLDRVLGTGFALLGRGTVAAGADVDWFEQELGGRVVAVGSDIDHTDPSVTKWFDTNDADWVLIRPDRHIYDAGNDGRVLCESLRTKLSEYSR